MAKHVPLKPFSFQPDDPLAPELSAVSQYVEDASKLLGDVYWQDVDIKSIPGGSVLLEGNAAQSRQYVMAALKQAQHWDKLADQIRSQATTDYEKMNAHNLPGWDSIWVRRRQAVAVITALMRRTLPFDTSDLQSILEWCCGSDNLSSYHFPLGAITRALERHMIQNSTDDELVPMLKQFAGLLRTSNEKDAQRLGTTVEQLFAAAPCEEVVRPRGPSMAAPKPDAFGSPLVLRELKQQRSILPKDSDLPSSVIGPDQFPMLDDSPLRNEHLLLSDFFEQVVGTRNYHSPDFEDRPAGKQLLNLDQAAKGRALLAAAERHIHAMAARGANSEPHQVWQSRYATAGTAELLFKSDFTVERNGLFDLLFYLSIQSIHKIANHQDQFGGLIQQAENHDADSPLTEGERFVLWLFRAGIIVGPLFGATNEHVQRLSALIKDDTTFVLVPGEIWSDRLNLEVTPTTTSQFSSWISLLKHAMTATSPRPSGKWLKTAGQLLEAVGNDRVFEALKTWFPLVSQGQSIRRFGTYVGDTRGSSDTIQEENANCLRGLLWCVSLLPQRDQLTREVTSVALTAYKKVPGVGPRAVKVGNAAVYALSELSSKEAVGQLALLKTRVKFGTAQKEIEKAFDSAAAALNLPRDQVEELGVPSYGMEQVGRLSEEFGNYRAELTVTGSDAALQWFDVNGKALKSVPAKVKSEHKEELKDLQQALKDIQAMLPAQRDRIDRLFLLQKSWPISEWRERYHDHPVVGTIAQRLIWCVDGSPAFFCEGVPTNVEGTAIEHGQTAEVQLWHPVGRTIDEIKAWRHRLETLAITQPFKQAYREVYLLTDAELNTRTYSNRFAAHIIRQHQFNALCAARGWKNKLRLMVDDVYPPATKELTEWDLRAEFWIEGIGDDYGVDTNDAGTYLRLTTDQVRFHRIEAASHSAHAGGGGYGSRAAGPGQNNVNEPIPLAEIPALVFSEIMRDVDLFVGVASVGNDPTWQDGGPQGRYREYWSSYSFGELSATASTRMQVLERLVLRLKIAKRCSFSDRFLVVRGDIRTYKIHLGSGNILMEPNDQYLCIVPDARARASQDDLYLPFEGDSTLSIIISKALMLADDTKIKDTSITRQIKGG